MTANSPLWTRRTYRFDVHGSTHSLLPRIWEDDAVGIGATSSEFLTCRHTSRRSTVHLSPFPGTCGKSHIYMAPVLVSAS